MDITHLGHATVLVEVGGVRVLIDPGSFSDQWHGLTDLDAVLITHQHPDHVDPQQVPVLLAANPGARVYAEPSVPNAVGIDADPLTSGESVRVGSVEISAVGGEHAVIHRDIPVIGNVGVVLRAEGEPSLFHPGDSLASVPSGIDVLALPIMGPWAALKEHIDFVREVGARTAFPIHDALLSSRGWALCTSRVADLSDTAVVDWRDATPHTV